MPRIDPAGALPLALTMGDPAGIGPELAVKAWHDLSRVADGAAFALFADPETIDRASRDLGLRTPIVEIASASEATHIFGEALPVIPVRLAIRAVPGQPDSRNAAATIQSIVLAVTAVINGAASALVTNPIAKHVLRAAGFNHPGHTEFLAALAAELVPGCDPHPVMMLAGPDLRVVPLTIHEPLAAVPGLVTGGRIEQTARIILAALATDFAIASPRLAVAGLNPHAGESGSIGTEERDVIAPAIARLAAAGLAVTGPHSADTLFHAEARRRYDAVLCMYHDQALIPLKTLAFDDGVNVTLGLPFVRTSPDHGTAFDIAGRGLARPTSLHAALILASDLATRRRVAAGVAA